MVKLGDRNKRPPLWPWLVGLAVLALLMWGIGGLVSTGRGDTSVAAADSAAPAAPAPGPGAGPSDQEAVGPTPLGALVPLGVQHAGQRVSASGLALTATGKGGFWLRSDADAVIWVASRQPVKAGEQVQDLEGVLEPSRQGQAEERLKGNDVQRQAERMSGSQLATAVYLDAIPPDSSAVGSSVGGGSGASRGERARASRRAARPAARRVAGG